MEPRFLLAPFQAVVGHPEEIRSNKTGNAASELSKRPRTRTGLTHVAFCIVSERGKRGEGEERRGKERRKPKAGLSRDSADLCLCLSLKSGVGGSKGAFHGRKRMEADTLVFDDA
ncbi:hypothetical protein L249_0222 [Ophiocordyceps polyrhachis-furcata BCC 54312]|uniref:Uncharacterized protein n=1 Tax=Ophiocordyceps polyrhachis-furcata BCC 54312 TaxID=1330021 RepID=A0A367LF91_9HYPO|nr:hypothetical protein L249_0222 [Ophiocordyceps polyrhachis-furcata BCC 54312]